MSEPVILSPSDSTLVVSVADVGDMEADGNGASPSASVPVTNAVAEPSSDDPQEIIARPGPRLVVVPPPQNLHEHASVVSSAPPPAEETTLVGTPKAFVMDLESGTTPGEVSGMLEVSSPKASGQLNSATPGPTFAGPDSRSIAFEDQTVVAVPSETLLRACAEAHAAQEPTSSQRPDRAQTARYDREAIPAVATVSNVFGDCNLVDDDVTVITRSAPLPPHEPVDLAPQALRVDGEQAHTVFTPALTDMATQGADAGQVESLQAQGTDSLFAAPPPMNAELTLKGARIQGGGWSWSSQPKKLRRRVLLVVFIIMAGAWLMFLRPNATLAKRPAPRGGIVGVQPVAAETPEAPELTFPALSTGKVDLAKAAEHLAAGRLKEALPLYRALAAKHPDQPVYGVIAHILTREILERCRLKGESECR